jgi:hypothetical protein
MARLRAGRPRSARPTSCHTLTLSNLVPGRASSTGNEELPVLRRGGHAALTTRRMATVNMVAVRGHEPSRNEILPVPVAVSFTGSVWLVA